MAYLSGCNGIQGLSSRPSAAGSRDFEASGAENIEG